jgi:hypothetical protein
VLAGLAILRAVGLVAGIVIDLALILVVRLTISRLRR